MQTNPPAQVPELIFGLIAPIGVDLELVSGVLARTLREMRYDAHVFRLTKLMREVPDIGLPLTASTYIASYHQRIAFANAVRGRLGDQSLAALAVSALRAFRSDRRSRGATGTHSRTEASVGPYSDERDEEAPLPAQAYIIRQLKRPEEVLLLRSIYGKQFILVSAYAPETWRVRRIAEQERASQRGLVSDVEGDRLARELVAQDAKEAQEAHGQRVRDAFPLGGVFIDATSETKCEEALRRFVKLLFGNNQITPTHDEYGMYMAKSASLRSSDLSRQVGAAIFRGSGEVAAMGCNEVPKFGGGTYWAGDNEDNRDFVLGHDPNERIKTEILVDVLDRLRRGGHLSAELAQLNTVEASTRLLAEDAPHSVADSKVMDLIEFGRIVHAEMSAICDASRNGIPISSGTLYCTTFPCHLCAKLIVAAGLSAVVYLEPYPKSYASELHGDSISVDSDDQGGRVRFRAFIGISPYRYRDLFEKGRRKYSGGAAQAWSGGASQPTPAIEIFYPQYFKAEALIVGQLFDALNRGQDAAAERATD